MCQSGLGCPLPLVAGGRRRGFGVAVGAAEGTDLGAVVGVAVGISAAVGPPTSLSACGAPWISHVPLNHSVAQASMR